MEDGRQLRDRQKCGFPSAVKGRRARIRGRGARASVAAEKRPRDGGLQGRDPVWTVDIENEAKPGLRCRYHFQILLRNESAL